MSKCTNERLDVRCDGCEKEGPGVTVPLSVGTGSFCPACAKKMHATLGKWLAAHPDARVTEEPND